MWIRKRLGLGCVLEWVQTNRRWVRQRSVAENSAAAVGTLVRYLGVPLTQTTIRERLGAHPQFPGLHALLDRLNEWSLAPRAMKAGLEQLQDAELPALAHLAAAPGAEPRFVVVLTWHNM